MHIPLVLFSVSLSKERALQSHPPVAKAIAHSRPARSQAARRPSTETSSRNANAIGVAPRLWTTSYRFSSKAEPSPDRSVQIVYAPRRGDHWNPSSAMDRRASGTHRRVVGAAGRGLGTTYTSGVLAIGGLIAGAFAWSSGLDAGAGTRSRKRWSGRISATVTRMWVEAMCRAAAAASSAANRRRSRSSRWRSTPRTRRDRGGRSAASWTGCARLSERYQSRIGSAHDHGLARALPHACH
jgi:hypothetical protein